LESDDFEAFFDARKAALLTNAMGKVILVDEPVDVDPGFDLDESDDTDDL